jgi:hypothetical protein
LLEGGTKDLHIEHLNAVVVYITTVSPSISVETLEMTIQKIFQTQIEPGSIADEYIQRGRLQGLQEGNIQLIQTLQEILGLPASEASTLEHRSLEQLQAITAELRQQIRDRS